MKNRFCILNLFLLVWAFSGNAQASCSQVVDQGQENWVLSNGSWHFFTLNDDLIDLGSVREIRGNYFLRDGNWNFVSDDGLVQNLGSVQEIRGNFFLANGNWNFVSCNGDIDQLGSVHQIEGRCYELNGSWYIVNPETAASRNLGAVQTLPKRCYSRGHRRHSC